MAPGPPSDGGTSSIYGMDTIPTYSSQHTRAEFVIKKPFPRLINTLVGNGRGLSGLAAAVLYGISSTSMAFLNKTLLTTYNFHYPFAILVLQMLFTIIVLQALKRAKKVDFHSITWTRSRTFIFPSLCYALNAALGLYALGRMNIPMYGVLKRCTPVVSLLLGGFMLKKSAPSASVITSVLLMTMGCIIAGSGDLTFDLAAYICGGASNVTQALYLTLVQLYSEKRSTIETLYLNSVNTLPFLLIMSFLQGEPWQLYYDYDYSWCNMKFIILLFLVVGIGCLLNYSMFLCTAMNSALTTTVVGMFKTIVQTTLGFFTFGGVSINGTLLMGISMNLSGGIMYAVNKYNDSIKIVKKSPLPFRAQRKLHKICTDNGFNGSLTDHRISTTDHGIIAASHSIVNYSKTTRERKASEP